jgi:hypothetical protein
MEHSNSKGCKILDNGQVHFTAVQKIIIIKKDY